MQDRDMKKRELARQVYDYFRGHYHAPEMCQPADMAFVFGRADGTLAAAAGQLYQDDLVPSILVTGGAGGKDAGPLPALGLIEAGYLAALLAVEYEVPLENILIEPTARNGGENARFGLQMIRERGLEPRRIALVGHATNLFRLSLTFKREAEKAGMAVELQLIALPYDFLPKDEDLQLLELLKVADGPGNDWMAAAEDLPHDLVEQVREFQKAAVPA